MLNLLLTVDWDCHIMLRNVFNHAQTKSLCYKGRRTSNGTTRSAPFEVRLLALFDEDADREARKARFQAEVPETHVDGNVSEWVERQA